MRGAGTAATNMCLVAAGSAEAYYEIGIHCWDIAAGAVIVSEAGGVLMDVGGQLYPYRWNYSYMLVTFIMALIDTYCSWIRMKCHEQQFTHWMHKRIDHLSGA